MNTYQAPPLSLLLRLLYICSSFPDQLAPIGTYTTCINATSNATNSVTPVGVAEEAGTRAQQSQTNLLVNSTWTNLAAQTLPAIRTTMSNITSSARELNGSYATFTAIVQAAEAAVNNRTRAASASGRRLLQASASNSANASSGNVGSSGSQPGITVFAPSDKAIQTYLQQQGLTQQQLLGNQQRLLEIISYHIVPTQALSAQNLVARSSGRLRTLLPNITLGFMAFSVNVAGNNSSVVLLQDAVGTANVRDANMPSGRVSECQDLMLRLCVWRWGGV